MIEEKEIGSTQTSEITIQPQQDQDLNFDERPNPANQKQLVKDEMGLFYEAGSKWYLVEKKWWDRWRVYVKYDQNVEGEVEYDDAPSKIDNYDLVDQDGVSLKEERIIDLHYVLVPEKVWGYFRKWYGFIGQEFIRVMIEVGKNKETSVEVYPLNIKVNKVGKQSSDAIWVSISKSATIEDLGKKLKETYSTESPSMNIWGHIKQKWTMIKETKQTLDELGIIDGTDIIFSEVKSSTSTSQSTQKSNTSPMNSQLNQRMNQNYQKMQDNYQSRSMNTSGNSEPGAVGLRNLGNTCFMNSALQCLSNTPTLTKYLLEKRYEGDLNRNNPLGMGGKIAEEYANLITQIWSGTFSSVSPNDFKWIIGRFSPRFSGYQQHDSQELVAFLLDGLHEDLNRIQKKPYIQSSEEVKPELEVAREAWGNHLLRNDSIIVENFHGQLKSRVICPDDECGNVSVTFDPFMFLSVPIPSSESTTLEITYVSLNPEESMKKYSFKVEEEDSIATLKTKLSEKIQVNKECFIVADVYHNSIFRWMKNGDSLMNIRKSDNIFVYQVIEGSTKTLTIVQRIKDNTKYQGFEPKGIPSIVSIGNENITTTQLMALIKSSSERYKSNSHSETPFEQLVKISHLRHAHQTNGPEFNFTEDVRVPLDNKDYIVVTWQNRESFDDSCDKNVEIVKETQTDSMRNQNITLKDCLDLYVTEETLKENNEWFCNRCKKHKLAKKKFDIWFSPKYLIIHFKRFNVSRGYFNSRKNNSLVHFPVEGLDLTDYVKSEEFISQVQPVYDLYAVSIHGGSLDGGHYTAYGKNFKNNKWYHFNDSSVSPANPNETVSSGAYMLFYKRRDVEV